MISNGLEVIELSSYGAIGCTQRTAFTSMLTSSEEDAPNDIILKALRLSAYYNGGVGAPFILINSQNKEFEIVEK